MWQLKNFDTQQFVDEYWQKKPLLIRQAIPDFESLLTPEELAGLACEPGVHSRLVIEKDAEVPWQLSYGPFNEETFTSLPQTHYSLLVSECEKWIPEYRELLRQFEFIPKWRIDDLMISYAPDQGSVGPHVDEYDVFLIQAAGVRRWKIESSPRFNPQVIEDLDLAILQHFTPDQSWDLQPGDLLYLPPHIAHHGVAVGDGCLTCSVGFRAPTVSDVFDSFIMEASDQGLASFRYQDKSLPTQRDASEITRQEIHQFRDMLYRLLDQPEEFWPDVVGKLVSDATLSEDIANPDFDLSAIEQIELWQKHPDCRMFYFIEQEQIRVYMNGSAEKHSNTQSFLELLQLLTQQSVLPLGNVLSKMQADERQFVVSLIQRNILIPYE